MLAPLLLCRVVNSGKGEPSKIRNVCSKKGSFSDIVVMDTPDYYFSFDPLWSPSKKGRRRIFPFRLLNTNWKRIAVNRQVHGETHPLKLHWIKLKYKKHSLGELKTFTYTGSGGNLKDCYSERGYFPWLREQIKKALPQPEGRLFVIAVTLSRLFTPSKFDNSNSRATANFTNEDFELIWDWLDVNFEKRASDIYFVPIFYLPYTHNYLGVGFDIYKSQTDHEFELAELKTLPGLDDDATGALRPRPKSADDPIPANTPKDPTKKKHANRYDDEQKGYAKELKAQGLKKSKIVKTVQAKYGGKAAHRTTIERWVE